MATTLTLDQKRLSQLRTQLYGKPVVQKNAKQSKNNNEKNETVYNDPTKLGTEHYIRKDLIKVLTLSIVILTLQFAIHFALVHKWLVINFYGITY